MTADDEEADLRRRWSQLANDAGWQPDAAAAVVDDLLARYAEPGRAYHNRQHLLGCLTELDHVAGECEDRIAVAIALWFHDAVYDPRGVGLANEEASADLAADRLTALGEEPERVGRVRGLILDTSHRAEPATPDGRLIVDIDLSILGKNPTRFRNYDRAIRTEYAHVPPAAYRSGRLAVLRQFVDRPTIFRTPGMAVRYEERARANLLALIDRLERGDGPPEAG